jgi:hypothetical protein
MKSRSLIAGVLALAGLLACATAAVAQPVYVPPSVERAPGVYVPITPGALTFPDPVTGKATVVSSTNGLPVNCILGCGGGGGGGGDASAANQVITNNRIGDLVVSPAQYSLADRLKTINTTLGTPFQVGGSIGNTAFGISGTLPAFASTPTFNLGTLNGAATAANQTSLITASGTISDAVYAGSGDTSIIGALKGVYSRANALLGYYKTEDAVHTSGDNGIMALAVRQANPYSATTSSAAGDYDALHTTPTGELFVAKSDGAPVTVTPLTATGVLFTVDTLGWDSVAFQTTGTWTASVVFEASDDNTTFYSTNVYGVLGGGTSATTNVNSAFSYTAQHRYFRARVSAYTSGTVGAVGYMRTGPSQAAFTSVLGTGSATIGSTIGASWFSDTSTPLSSAATFTGTTRDLGATATTVPWAYFGSTFYSDVAGTAFVEFSNNNSTWYPWNGSAGTALAAGSTVDIKAPIRARYYRARYVNGATAQGTFNVNTSWTAN